MPQDLKALIRGATVDDAAAIAAVDVASWRAAYAGLMPDGYLDAMSVAGKTAAWERSLQREASRGKRTIVAMKRGRVIGYATVGPDVESNRGLLYLMYVAPERWGRGAGVALMAGARDALIELGHAEAALWVLEANERARRFYERDGWRVDGASQTNDYGGVELLAIRMARSLRT